MTYKWIRKSFLIAISFLLFGLVFSCKTQNDVPNKSGKFVITFKVTPEEGGSITAIADDVPIESGAKVKKNTEVVFTLTLKGNYTIDKWLGDGLKTNENNSLVFRLKVSQDVMVEAKLKDTSDPSLELKSLRMYNKDVELTNSNDVKVEVENFVQTLDSDDVVAKFTYGTHTIPEEIEVKIDKNRLGDDSTFVNLSVPAVEGSYKPWNQQVKITRKTAPEPGYIPEEVRLSGIEVALLTKKKKYENYVSVRDFISTSSGPYLATEDAKTAYVAIRVKAEKPFSGDYRIELNNKTAYIETRKFSRGSNEESSYLILKDIALSKGHNVLEISVKSPVSDETRVYTVIVKYDGGPDPLTLEMEKRNVLAGVYCPAQRKPLEGESPDFVWMICISGS